MKINGSELNKSSLWDLRKAIGFCRASHSTPLMLARNKGRATVELVKKPGYPLGLTISAGTDKDGKARVAQLKVDSIIYRADILDIGDVVIGVNQTKTIGLKHEQVIELIKQSGEQLIFEIEYDLPKWPLHPTNTVHTRTIQIQLEKEGQSYGFVLRGGRTDDPTKTRPLIITKIRPQGPADKEGTIKIGDRVLAINGINVNQSSLTEAYEIMQQCRGTTLFMIEYDVAIVESIKHATGSLLIEIEKSPGTTIGLTLAQRWTRANQSIIVIDSVKPASIADRCGALHCGDQINAIDYRSLLGLSLNEANAILRSCTGDFCRIEVTPASLVAALHHLIESTPNRDSIHDVTYAIPHRPSLQNPSQQWTMRNNQLNSLQRSIQKARHNSLNFTPMANPSPSVMKMYNLRDLASLNSSCQSILSSPISHTETMECLLRSDSSVNHTDGHKGNLFGLTLQSLSYGSDILLQAPIIGYLEAGGIAERSSILQPGDRVLAINGQSLEGMTLTEAQSLIKDSTPQLQLDIEFDVADSVMLSSGTCEVKLLRKNLDLGLSVTYSRSSRTDEVPIISHVKRGSIAHRCGMIQAGDRLLSVDGHSLRGKSLHEIVTLLKNTEDIVRLKIKKDENYAEDNLSGNSVVYKVQLFRQGGPLGLTISGSEDVFEPIVVSNLCEGGLAERTNAVHVGDRILAINDISLRGKGLHEAIELLQTSGDEITLKISRSLPPSQKDYTPSVDSAMDSWDSSHADPSTATQSDFLLKPTTHRSTLIIPDRRTPNHMRPHPDTMTVVLHRDKRIHDFGFSISDRLYGTGVYINKIRANGPAELEGSLTPQMRIYQVNDVDVTRMECSEVVPLLCSSPDQLRLVVGRRPAPMFDETDEWLAMNETTESEEKGKKTIST